MRRRLALVLIAMVALLAACQGGGTTNDPYQLAFNASKANWDQVQIDLAVSAQTGSDSINLQPGSVRLVIDSKAGKGLVHLSIPTSALGASAADLAPLGLTGNTLDFDVLYDGQALYAKSPLGPALIQLLYASSGGAPTGDLTGWLKLGTAADFASLAALGGSSIPTASGNPISTVADANALKTQLTAMGITLTYVATEQHNGTNADHLNVAVDWAKLAASPEFQSSSSQAQVQQVITALQDATVTIDLWVDHSAGRLIGIELKGASKADPTQTFDFSVSLKTPDAGTSLDAPSSSVEVPLMTLLGPLVQGMMGGSLTP
jgi:hypothetical protein